MTADPDPSQHEAASFLEATPTPANPALEEALRARNEALSYFNFTQERIHRAQVDAWESHQKLLIAAHHRGNTKRLRVLFMVPDTSLWDVYEPIYRTIQALPYFEVAVLAFKRLFADSDKSGDEVREFFENRGITARIEGFDEIYKPVHPASVDLIFYTLGSIAYPDLYKIEYLSLSHLTCYLSYGFLMIEEENYHFNQDFHHAAWRVFASTKREERLYNTHCKRRCSNVMLAGYPKFDAISAPVHSFAHKRKMVIWAPHWTVQHIYPKLNFGLFDQLCQDMLALMQARLDIDFVYKPHGNLMDSLIKLGIFSPSSYELYMQSLHNLPNVIVWKHGDYAALFRYSDAMITDSISFLAEYLATDHPLLFLSREDRGIMSVAGESIASLHYQGRTMADIQDFIDKKVVKGRDPMRKKRLAQRHNLLELDQGVVAKRIIQHIEHEVLGF
jgi:hypothetical protein